VEQILILELSELLFLENLIYGKKDFATEYVLD